MAGLPVLKKCGKIQNVASSSDFEIFSPEIHALMLTFGGKIQIIGKSQCSKMRLLCMIFKDSV